MIDAAARCHLERRRPTSRFPRRLNRPVGPAEFRGRPLILVLGPSDEEIELVGGAVMERDEFASPEEAALSVRDAAPGATDHDDPNPADGD